jgi:hypothetical protein
MASTHNNAVVIAQDQNVKRDKKVNNKIEARRDKERETGRAVSEQ